MPRLALFFVIGFACLSGCAALGAEQDPFAVSGVTVDATAASAAAAQNIAINAGRSRAWTVLFQRLTKASDWPRQPSLDDTALQRLISNYLVSHERRSTTRFVADMTYVFNGDAVRRLLRSQNIPYVDMEAKPVVVVPMAPGYMPRSAWATLWSNPKYASATPPLVLPVGDAPDARVLGALNFAGAQWPDVEAAASRVRATSAYLVQAVAGKGEVAVSLRELTPSGAVSLPSVTVRVRPGESAVHAYGAAADSAALAIADAWKARAAIDFNKHSKLIAEVHTASLPEWGGVVQKLSTIPTVSDVAVIAMDIGEARIALSFVGTLDQLQAFAAQAGLDLSNAGGSWQVTALNSAPEPAPAPASR